MGNAFSGCWDLPPALRKDRRRMEMQGAMNSFGGELTNGVLFLNSFSHTRSDLECSGNEESLQECPGIFCSHRLSLSSSQKTPSHRYISRLYF